MNPELRRNLWLECSWTRLALMAGVVALVTFAAWVVNDGSWAALQSVGAAGFVFIAIVWGARNAARSVLGEVRERTWDFQRLSAIAPWSMTIGKLFGSTSYVWFGGLLALGVLTVAAREVHGGDAAMRIAIGAILLGVLAQAVAMGSALSSARRRRSDARVAMLPHQVAGVAAALGLVIVFSNILTNSDNVFTEAGVRTEWWGVELSMVWFFIASAAAFAAFAVVGCWRLMRLELMASNAPLLWPAFLVFVAAYAAGFADSNGGAVLSAYLAVHAAALAAALVEPKNLLQWRAMGAAVETGHIGRALAKAPAFSWGLTGAAVLAIVGSVVSVTGAAPLEDAPTGIYLTLLGFLARDIAIFVFFHANPRQDRGDFAALVTLALLYVIGGSLADATGVWWLKEFFRPGEDMSLLTAAGPWAQAFVLAIAAGLRLSRAGPGPASAPAIAAA